MPRGVPVGQGHLAGEDRQDLGALVRTGGLGEEPVAGQLGLTDLTEGRVVLLVAALDWRLSDTPNRLVSGPCHSLSGGDHVESGGQAPADRHPTGWLGAVACPHCSQKRLAVAWPTSWQPPVWQARAGADTAALVGIGAGPGAGIGADARGTVRVEHQAQYRSDVATPV